MTQEWDDILSEPIAQLQPDLSAAAGGWRAVRSIDEVSPRPQQPPLTLPDPDGMLSIRLPVQPEESGPASAPPPPSLTDQLSLTWASKKKRSQPATEEPMDDGWPAWQPPAPTEPEAPEVSSPVLSLFKPLQRLARLFKGKTAEEEAPSQPARVTIAREAGIPAAERTSRIQPEAQEAVAEGRPVPPTLEGAIEVPLTLATRLPAAKGIEATRPAIEPSSPIQTAARAPQRSPEAAAASVGARSEGVLRRFLKKTQPSPEVPTPPIAHDDHQTEAEPAVAPRFQPVPLVARREPAAKPEAAHDHDEPQMPPVAARPVSAPQEEGQPLSPVLLERMEKLLDVPLKEVRVFRNSIAHEATHARRADALAVGTEVHMAPGQGNPGTPSGQALLAHELSHVAAHIKGRRDAPEVEERHAQALEHSLKTQPALNVAKQPATTTMPRLEHRAQPGTRSQPSAAPTTTTFTAPGYSSGGFVGGPASSGFSGGSGPTVSLAPTNRITSGGDSGGGGGGAQFRGNTETFGDVVVTDEEPEQTGGVDRIVDAVMRRLRREGTFERERRGAFRSEIGG